MSQRSSHTARSQKRGYIPRRERPLGHLSPSRTLGTRPLGPLTSKLLTTTSLLPHSAWRPDSGTDLPDGELGPFAASIPATLSLPAILLPRTLASNSCFRFTAKSTPRATFRQLRMGSEVQTWKVRLTRLCAKSHSGARVQEAQRRPARERLCGVLLAG